MKKPSLTIYPKKETWKFRLTIMLYVLMGWPYHHFVKNEDLANIFAQYKLNELEGNK